MKLGEFIRNFSHNNIIKLHYKIKGGYESVLEDYDQTSMDWEVNKAQGPFRHYINNEVLGLVGIVNFKTSHSDVINIVIERLDEQPYVEEVIEDKSIYQEACDLK